MRLIQKDTLTGRRFFSITQECCNVITAKKTSKSLTYVLLIDVKSDAWIVPKNIKSYQIYQRSVGKMLRLYAGVCLICAGVLVVLEFKFFHSGIFNGLIGP